MIRPTNDERQTARTSFRGLLRTGSPVLQAVAGHGVIYKFREPASARHSVGTSVIHHKPLPFAANRPPFPYSTATRKFTLSAPALFPPRAHIYTTNIHEPIVRGTRKGKMRVLITGATGMIGGEALLNCLASPQVTSVVAFTRRQLPKEVSANEKLTCVMMEDFGEWPQDKLESAGDADAMIW